MAFGVLAGQITVIFLEVLLGYVGARSGIIKDRDSKFLSDFIMKLLLPCTMLAGAAVDGEPELLTQAGVLFVLLLALFVATTGLCRLSSWLHHDTPGKYAVLVGTAAMPNCGFIGLPLCSALLGTARGTVFAGMAMASYNVWFFTYVLPLFSPPVILGKRTINCYDAFPFTKQIFSIRIHCLLPTVLLFISYFYHCSAILLAVFFNQTLSFLTELIYRDLIFHT